MPLFQNIVILTGAGISAESGIKTFRDAGGLWENHPVEEVATPQGFARNPALVHQFYNERRQQLETVEANAAHIALAELQAKMAGKGGRLTIITQNVDDLHERGGAENVIHMHGELKSHLCSACYNRWQAGSDTAIDTRCNHCGEVGTVRPDIVWFGEIPYHMKMIEALLAECNLFVSIGTSGAVYPAAGFVQLARSLGCETLEINLEPSEGSHHFHKTRLGPATSEVRAWVDEQLNA